MHPQDKKKNRQYTHQTTPKPTALKEVNYHQQREFYLS